MNVVVIGKPRIDVTQIVDKYPEIGTNNTMVEREIIASGESLYIAVMLAKWGIKVTYMGLIGGEEEGIKVKSLLESLKVDTRYVEINYEVKTDKNYSILTNDGIRTNIHFNNQKSLTKYRFDFEPDYIITDGSEVDGLLGVINNYPLAKVIMLARETTKKCYNLTKKSSYVVASPEFAEAATKMQINLKKSKTLVDIMQKLQDLENAKYTINLNGNGTLYVKERQVKFIPKIETTIRDRYMMETAFFGAFAYGIINNLDLDVVGKISNMANYKAAEKIGNINNIPNKEEVFTAAGVKEENTIQNNSNIEKEKKVNTEIIQSENIKEEKKPIESEIEQKVEETTIFDVPNETVIKEETTIFDEKPNQEVSEIDELPKEKNEGANEQ